MKKYLLIIILFSTNIIKAQFVNMDFENWTNDSTPIGWTVNVQPVEKGDSAHSGNYCLKLKTAPDGSSGGNVSQLVSVNFRPTSFAGYWKKVSAGIENLQFYLSVLDSLSHEIGHIGPVNMPNVQNAWIPINYPVNYSSTNPAASIYIQFQWNAFGFYPTHYGAVDDISFPGFVGLNSVDAINKILSLSPNPFQNKITLHFSSTQNEKAQVRIFNSIGEIVFEESGIWNRESNINLSKLPQGIYFVAVQQEKKYYGERIMKVTQ